MAAAARSSISPRLRRRAPSSPLRRLEPMSEAKIYAELGEIFRDVFLTDDIELRPELSAKDVPGWDSFKQIDIVLAVEEKYRIKLNTRELDSLQNVGDLVRVIAAKTGG